MYFDPVQDRWRQRYDDMEKEVEHGGKQRFPTIGRIVDELEFKLPEEIERPDFAATVDGDDRFIAT